MFDAEAIQNAPPIDSLTDVRRQIYFHLPVLTNLPSYIPPKKSEPYREDKIWREKMLTDIKKGTERFPQWKGIDRSQITALAEALDIKNTWSVNDKGVVRATSQITDSFSPYRWLMAHVDKGGLHLVHMYHRLIPTSSVSINAQGVGRLLGDIFELPSLELQIRESMRDNVKSYGVPVEQQFIEMKSGMKQKEDVLAFANAIKFSQIILDAVERQARDQAKAVIENIPEINGEFLEDIIEARTLEALKTYARKNMDILYDDEFDFHVSVSEREITIAITRGITSEFMAVPVINPYQEIIYVFPLSERIPDMLVKYIELGPTKTGRHILPLDIPSDLAIQFSFDYFPYKKNTREGSVGSYKSKMRVLMKFNDWAKTLESNTPKRETIRGVEYYLNVLSISPEQLKSKTKEEIINYIKKITTGLCAEFHPDRFPYDSDEAFAANRLFQDVQEAKNWLIKHVELVF